MIIQDHRLLAEPLRLFLLEQCPFIPVKGGAFFVDNHAPEGESLMLQMNMGITSRKFIDGTRVMLQPFTLYYRAPLTDENADRSDMQAALNTIGAWMDDNPTPHLGDWLRVDKMEMTHSASVADRVSDTSPKYITYQAGYALGYETIA